MITLVTILTLVFLNFSALASGCDSRYFYKGELISQATIHKINGPKLEELQALSIEIQKAHKNALHYWHTTPKLDNVTKIKIVSSTYENLDTDCGWSKFGSRLNIIHLKIFRNEGYSYLPDIYKDIDPEFSFPDLLINIMF